MVNTRTSQHRPEFLILFKEIIILISGFLLKKVLRQGLVCHVAQAILKVIMPLLQLSKCWD